MSYLPVGSEQATKWYVEQILEAGCGFVNCIPVFIAREDYWNERFKKAGLPIIGDDIKSQVGATITHRMLARLFHDRGVKILRTSQLNVGGNMDFFNMLERERLESKKISKTNAVTSIMGHTLPADDVYIGPSDYVPWLTDRKWAHIRLEGQAFGDVPLNLELKLEVWDSPNSAGIVIDAVRCCKLALNHGVAGQLDGPSSYLMKSPHTQRPGRRGARRPRVHRSRRRSSSPRPRRGQAPAASRRGDPRRPGVGTAPASGLSCARVMDPIALAQVTPYAWDAGHELNQRGRAPRPELAERGHRVVIVAPGSSQELVHETCGASARAATPSSPTTAALACSPWARRCPAGRAAPPLPIDVARAVEELFYRGRSTSATSTSRSPRVPVASRCATRAR